MFRILFYFTTSTVLVQNNVNKQDHVQELLNVSQQKSQETLVDHPSSLQG